MNEEHLLAIAFKEEGISPKHRASIRRYLEILRTRSKATYHHSLRVGLLAREIAKHANISGVEPKALLWAGLLHDAGKALIDPALLEKTGAFTEADFKEMEPHAEYGWRLLQGIHEHTAHIIVRHHRFGPHPYPKKLPPLPAYAEARRDVIEASARLLALADYYDALTTRKNDKFKRTLTAREKREKYLKDNADQRELILRLENEGVLNFSA